MPKTKQEMFIAVWRYFILEKHKQAVKEVPTAYGCNDFNCYYRGPESNCAIGCQLPDALYNPQMEGKGITEVCNLFPAVQDYFGEENMDFARVLQRAHDNDFDTLELKLIQIAQTYNLQIPQPE